MSCSTACSIPILILAAGQSKRMRGRDKLLELVRGQSLLRQQANNALEATSGPVLIALPPAPHPRYDTLQECDVQLVPVPDAAEGMSASLRRGLNALPKDTPAVMVVLADLPDLTAEDMRKVCAGVRLEGSTLIWRGATQTGAPGHPIVFHYSLFDTLKKMRGDTGGAQVVARNHDRMVLIPLPDNHARRDLDTPEDWEEWRASQETET